MAETRRNEAQDPSGIPAGANLDAGHGPARNRPAVGAREANAPPPGDSGWQAGAGATDFLGLEPDLRAGSDAGSSTAPTESWLFDIEQSDMDFSPTAAATATADSAAFEPASAEPEYAADPTATSDEDLEPELELVPPSPARSPRKRALVAVTLLALATAGGWYAWQRFAARPAPTMQVATANPVPAPAKPAKKPVAPPTVAKPADATPSAPAAGPAAVAPPVLEPAVETRVAAATATPPENLPTVAEPTPVEPTVALAPAEPVTPVLPAPTVEPLATTTTSAPLARSANLPAKAPELPTGDPGPGGGRHATDRDLAGMWLEPTIPTDAIRGAARLRTLNVGLVRAELVNGEFIEGRLHAVGESRIWIDVKLGRMSFDASDVRDLVQIVGAQGQPLPLGSQALAGLPRVEVLLPGGSLMGRVLDRDGDRVTFVTEDGMRLRVEAIDVRPAPNGRSRLVGPAAARKP
ncbi:MAG: hypothetical protein NTY35_09090 [Planctomycetota bacterium]|nr:hypothetical protein [Planctomycetota bacterium]